MKLLDEWEISKWAFEQYYYYGSRSKEIKFLITVSCWAYDYCKYVEDDLEVRKYVTDEYYINKLELMKEEK